MPTGAWSVYAKTAMLEYAIPGSSPTASPTAFWCALFIDSANPDDSSTNTEVAVTGYARFETVIGGVTSSPFVAANPADLDFSAMDPVTVNAVALYDDDTAGNCYAYWALDAPLIAVAGVIIPANELTLEGERF